MPFPNEIRPGENWIAADIWIGMKEKEAERQLPVEDLGIFSTNSSDSSRQPAGKIPRHYVRSDDLQPAEEESRE